MKQTEKTDDVGQFTEILAKIPSRFIGHPGYCGFGGNFGEGFISTEPYYTEIN